MKKPMLYREARASQTADGKNFQHGNFLVMRRCLVILEMRKIPAAFDHVSNAAFFYEIPPCVQLKKKELRITAKKCLDRAMMELLCMLYICIYIQYIYDIYVYVT